ncbi:peptidoglycan-binding protein LysM [Streptomyces sp. D2-8]|uniref:peptidoglycan-binding protein LysM n=1 Tax=Streptomyces sp. D2-8 TaxID=2707767 RepID=UPI0020BE3619|nr:peptidoglycan-binding protein LysM [Streptomyces sp. D2-8]
MPLFHAAVIHPDRPVTYHGTVDEYHLKDVRAVAALPSTPRHVIEHPRHPGSVFVLREDGDLDWYQPVRTAPAPSGAQHRGKPAGRVEPGRTAAATATAATQDQGTLWIGQAIRCGDGVIGGPMDTPGNPPRVVHHTTESPAGGKYLEAVTSYLIKVSAEPHLIYCPVTDRVGQFGPLHHSARALRNDGSRRTNREGRVCIQIEVLGRAATPWTAGWNPRDKAGWQQILTAIRSWDVPDLWPAGPAVTYPDGSTTRSRSVWQSQGGHFGHCHVPGNDHGDPGAIDTVKVMSARAQPRPGGRSRQVSLAHVVAAARKDPPGPDGHRTHPADVQTVENALVTEGLLEPRYADGSFGTKSIEAYAAWQRSEAGGSYRGRDADGTPGHDSLTRLGKRHGFTVIP